MPAGFGYGAVGSAFSAVRSAFKMGASQAGRGAANLYARQGAGLGAKNIGLGIGAASLRGAGMGMKGLSRMSNAGLATVGGATMGGAYGAMSDDTSVLGGALMGAGLVGGARLGMGGYNAYSSAMARGVSRHTAASAGLHRMGRMSSRFFRSSYNRAVNGFSGMRG